MNMKGEARIAGAGSTEDVPACFSFGIVYLELSRRGGKVNIGKYGSTEVDFVTQKEGVLTYYQVTADMTAEETFERDETAAEHSG
jgi:predicted AAA+ superfamily ATPase